MPRRVYAVLARSSSHLLAKLSRKHFLCPVRVQSPTPNRKGQLEQRLRSERKRPLVAFVTTWGPVQAEEDSFIRCSRTDLDGTTECAQGSQTSRGRGRGAQPTKRERRRHPRACGARGEEGGGRSEARPPFSGDDGSRRRSGTRTSPPTSAASGSRGGAATPGLGIFHGVHVRRSACARTRPRGEGCYAGEGGGGGGERAGAQPPCAQQPAAREARNAKLASPPCTAALRAASGGTWGHRLDGKTRSL